ncbi:MAG: OmpA family protein [Pseudomonadota bacterium]
MTNKAQAVSFDGASPYKLPTAAQTVRHAHWKTILCAASLSLAALVPASAQQRSILNTGFEDGPQFPGPGGFFIRPDTSTLGWLSTDGEVEIWATGHSSQASASGSYHAELNPNNPIGLYQEVCLTNGEALSWSYDHAARSGGANPQTILYEIVSTDGGTTHQVLQSSSLPAPASNVGNTFTTRSGTTTYSGPTGIQRMQFRSTNPGSSGNFLDNISLTLVPYIELSSGTGSDLEATGGNMIQLAISGNVTAPLSIPFTVTGGTATNGVDYNVTAGSVSIPAGNYDGSSASSFFPLPISIVDDGTPENDETIIIELSATSGPAAQVAALDCSSAPITRATYTISDDDTAPVASNDVISTPTNGPVSVNPLTNDGGTTLDPTTVVLTGTGAPAGSTLAPDGKTLTVPGEGVWTVDPASGVVTFTSEAGFTGPLTVAAYTVNSIGGITSNEATISAAVNSPPQIEAIQDSFAIDDAATGGTTPTVVRNDNQFGSPITNPSLVTVTPGAAPTPAAGSITMNGDGTITVAPGTTVGSYSYPYQICDASAPTVCSTALATVVVGASSLIDEIEEDLVSVLEDDRAATVSRLSEQMNGFAANAGQRLRDRTGQGACLAQVNAILDTDNVLFDTDKAIIKPQSARVLDEIAAVLRGCAGSAFEIAGHTDSDASDAYNLDLSQRRVDAVLRALAARDVDTTGFTARGYGESRPIASNATAAGKAQNRRVEFLPLGTDMVANGCESDVHVRSLDAAANGDGANVDGQFLRDTHDCARDIRTVYEGSLSYLDVDGGVSQTMLNLTYRRERFTDADSIRGYFAGAYLSKSSVSGVAEGDIDGIGINGGIYGADRLNSGLYVDYYLGAAVGKHDYELDFQAVSGPVTAGGKYTYYAAFAGAAISGDLEFGEKTVSPRVGVDYVYAPESDVDVSSLNGAPVSGSLELSSLSGGRLFAEVATEWDVNEGAARLGVTPRVACYEALNGLDRACGFGGSVELTSIGEETGLVYSLQLDGEVGDDYSRAALTGSVSRTLDVGTVGASAKLSPAGDIVLDGAYALQF